MKTSNKPLASAVEHAIADDLAIVMAGLQSEAEVKQFFQDFFSETEQAVFTKRLAIARMLAADESYDSITRKLRVSTATVASTNDFVDSLGFKLAQKKLQLDAWADKMSKRLWPFK